MIIRDTPKVIAEVVAAAINQTQIQPSEIKLGHDLLPVAKRLLAALDGWTLVPTNSDSTIEHIARQNEEIMSLRESLLDLGLRYEEQYDALVVVINAVKVKGVEEWVHEEVRVAEYVIEHPLSKTTHSRFWKVPIPDD
jgi:hypothetical protein